MSTRREILEFVRVVARHKDGASRKSLPVVIDRAQDRARQAARKLGYVWFRDGKWHATEAGKEALRSPAQ